MQDIRKPYNRSRSNNLDYKVEEFESNSYLAENKNDSTRVLVDRRVRQRRNIDQMEMYPKRRQLQDEEFDEEEVRSINNEISYRDPRTVYKRKKQGSFGTLMFIITTAVIVIGALLLTFVFNSATITIVPKYLNIDDFHKTLIFSNNTSNANAIPFIIATSSITKTKKLTLSDSKMVQSKASGKIVVYNNFDSNPQKLIKGTRFESSAGKIYRINQSIIVPGKVGDKPGSFEIDVYADSYGADYNSDPTDFTIPGFKGSQRYTGFFGRSNGAITGGSSGNMQVASLSDLNTAKDELALELAQEIKDNLSKIKKDDYIGMYSAPEIVYIDNQQDILNGSSDTYQVTATGYLMLADSSSLAKRVLESQDSYSDTNISVRLIDTDTFTYSKKDTDHITSSSSLDILVDGKPRVIWLLDKENIKKIVAGAKRIDFESIMKNISSIKTAEISFSPLWLSTFPSEINKINIVESIPKR